MLQWVSRIFYIQKFFKVGFPSLLDQLFICQYSSISVFDDVYRHLVLPRSLSHFCNFIYLPLSFLRIQFIIYVLCGFLLCFSNQKGTSSCKNTSVELLSIKLVKQFLRYRDFFSRWQSSTIMNFWMFVFLMATQVRRPKVHQHAKFHSNLSNGCWMRQFIDFSRWWPSAILDLLSTILDPHKGYMMVFIVVHNLAGISSVVPAILKF